VQTPTVTLREKDHLQPILGFGAALTETAAYNLKMLKTRDDVAYKNVLVSLFASHEFGGAGISLMRYPISSTDLSLPTEGWSYDDAKDDVNLMHFNTDHAGLYQIPVLLDILALQKTHGANIKLLGCPW